MSKTVRVSLILVLPVLAFTLACGGSSSSGHASPAAAAGMPSAVQAPDVTSSATVSCCPEPGGLERPTAPCLTLPASFVNSPQFSRDPFFCTSCGQCFYGCRGN